MRCIVLKTHVGDAATDGQPGQIAKSDSGLSISTGDGMLVIDEIQPEGKKAMDAAAFANGYGITAGKFGASAAG